MPAPSLRAMVPAQDKPKAEVDIDDELVRSLLREQHPDVADLPLLEVEAGWDNAIFRLGSDLAVRLPRRALSAVLVAHEQRWLPDLAQRISLPTSAPLRAGRPGSGFPWSWSICRWLPGTSALVTEPDDPFGAAEVLGRFVSELHHPAPDDAPDNPWRGVPLSERAGRVHEELDRLGDRVDGTAVLACWSELLATPPWTGPPMWLHGDLHPGNILVDGGGVSAVIDLGDLTSGDPATDLAVGWMLLPPPARPAFRAAAGAIDDDTWTRGRAWALTLALAILGSSADNPAYDRLGSTTLVAALEG